MAVCKQFITKYPDNLLYGFSRAKIVNRIDVTISNCCLKKTDSLKYLGVIIDHRLNWSQHIAHVKNKVSKGIGIIIIIVLLLLLNKTYRALYSQINVL